MSEANVDTYALGRSHQETERLIWSAKQMRLSITRFLEDAGLQAGMKVLDIGCGAGDVSLLAAEIVGPFGSVVGIDLNDGILETARNRAKEAGFGNVTFLTRHIPEELAGLPADFDALIGRRVLCYIPSPADVLKALLTHVKPGGLVAFQEIDHTVWGWHSSPEAASYGKIWGWIYQAFEAGGTQMDMGTGLYQVFVNAGLPEPAMKAEAGVGPASASMEFTSRLLHSLRETIVKHGIVAPDFDLDAAISRAKEELTSQSAVATGGFEVCAWARRA